MLLQVGIDLDDGMLKFWNVLYENVLLEYMYVNKLFWSVPKIEVVRGEYSKISENYHERNNDIISNGNENENKHNVDSRNLQRDSGDDDNQNIESNSNILSVQPPCPQSQSQSRTILLPLGGKFDFW